MHQQSVGYHADLRAHRLPPQQAQHQHHANHRARQTDMTQTGKHFANRLANEKPCEAWKERCRLHGVDFALWIGWELQHDREIFHGLKIVDRLISYIST